MLAQASKAILWVKDASRKHMSTEIGGGVISNLECVETMI